MHAQIGVNWDMKKKVNGIFSATRTGNIQQELERIARRGPDSGRQQEEIKQCYQRRK